MFLIDWLHDERMSITDFASKIGVDRSYVYMWLNGNWVPSEKIMAKIREVSLNKVLNAEDLLITRGKRRGRIIELSPKPFHTYNVGVYFPERDPLTFFVKACEFSWKGGNLYFYDDQKNLLGVFSHVAWLFLSEESPPADH